MKTGAPIILNEQLCICGSNKPFIDCCKKKNHLYEAIVLKDTGRHVIYDQTEIIMAVQNLNNFIKDRIENVNSKLSINEGLRKLRRLYEKLDNALKPIQKVASCKQGCNHCCYLPILSTELENELIKEYIKDNYSADELTEFENRITENKDTFSRLVNINGKFSEDNYSLYSTSNIRCSFLNDDNNCMIYEVRPYVCRKYLVFNDPVVCKNTLNKTEQYYSNYHVAVKEAIVTLNELTFDDHCQYKHILSWFV